MPISDIRVGASSATNGGSAPAPELPASLVPGDVVVVLFYSRSTTGSVSISAGWTELYNSATSGGLLAAWVRVWRAGDSAPTLTLGGHTGGASGDTPIAQMFAYAGGFYDSPVGVGGTIQANASQANIGPLTGITPTYPNSLVLAHGGRADDWSNVATLPTDPWVEGGEPNSVLGADAGMVWDYWIQTGAAPTATGDETFVVTGGANAVGAGTIIELRGVVPSGIVPVRYVVGVTANVVPVEILASNAPLPVGTIVTREVAGPANVVPARIAEGNEVRIKTVKV